MNGRNDAVLRDEKNCRETDTTTDDIIQLRPDIQSKDLTELKIGDDMIDFWEKLKAEDLTMEGVVGIERELRLVPSDATIGTIRETVRVTKKETLARVIDIVEDVRKRSINNHKWVFNEIMKELTELSEAKA